MKTVLLVVLSLVLVVAAVFATRSYLSRGDAAPGLEAGRLRACPSSPNCVASESASGEALVAALPYRSDRAATERALASALATLPRTAIQRRQGDYWHVTSTTALFRFIDDVEFRFDDGAGLVQLRSASRVGYSDFGANRKRVEAIRAAYMAAGD
jgi:uncharacterized protein (DUF1499 family)